MAGYRPRARKRHRLLAFERFDVFQCAIPGGLPRHTSMLVEFEAYGLEARFWIAPGLTTTQEWIP
jgi:hypothetical protein